ncbi:PAS domain-containing protein [Chondromyces apiculatus]|uniref:RsbR, positive regulator of sigma-B n=1 Tax=Chondromyces apiculatus DSM 436 TaxID=1192034 RepID=A0A017SWU4_9BACT|nr:PAS domain-containing protein [Chondromyces apiculatus]EYF01439.1 RsbR, positive regulator of sigma-B [Chondromyces apiculatus DSM 436]
MSALLSLLTSMDWSSSRALQQLIDAIPDPIFVKDLQHRWIACNAGLCKLLGQPYEKVIGHSDPEYVTAEQAAEFWAHDDLVFRTGKPDDNEETHTIEGGQTRTIWTRKFPIKNAAGEVTGLCAIITDITEIKQRLGEAERIERENAAQRLTIAAQAALLDRMAVPVLQVWQGILLVPLVGEINARRAATALTNLLDAVVQHHAAFALLDLTGVLVFDGEVARYLARTVQATELLGCECVLVGIGPEIARTLVSLNIHIEGVATRGTLQGGLAYAKERLSR